MIIQNTFWVQQKNLMIIPTLSFLVFFPRSETRETVNTIDKSIVTLTWNKIYP